jgi:hypothetical protein
MLEKPEVTNPAMYPISLCDRCAPNESTRFTVDHPNPDDAAALLNNYKTARSGYQYALKVAAEVERAEDLREAAHIENCKKLDTYKDLLVKNVSKDPADCANLPECVQYTYQEYITALKAVHAYITEQEAEAPPNSCQCLKHYETAMLNALQAYDYLFLVETVSD